MSFDRAAFIVRYCEEAGDHLRAIDDALLALEAAPGDAEPVAAAMRSMHTLKGASRMLKVTDVAALAHAAEDLLMALRDGRFGPGPGHVTLLLTAADRLREMIGALREGREGAVPAEDLVAALRAAAEGTPPQLAESAAAPPADTSAEPG
ncbi:MAG: Hpt domain-containing protein, partial [Candidatus Sericytochromatia bacterium]|nr:Hpt domain-containing protein [Candidatus Tanganyikabacteria bacterium]